MRRDPPPDAHPILREPLVLLVALHLGALSLLGAPLAAQGTLRVSVSSTGAQGNDQSFWPSISADGRYVAFTSAASTLVPGDTNAAWDVFVRERSSGITECASVDPTGAPGNGYSAEVTLSANGLYAVFTSYATNLVPGDANGTSDVFVRDLTAGTTEIVSVDSAQQQGHGDCHHPVITPDGRYVAFTSFAPDLVPGDTNGRADIFVRDRVNGTTERVSVDPNGVQGDGDSQNPVISADGRFVAFESSATNLVPLDTNGKWDIFLRDRQNGSLKRISVDSNGLQGNDNSLNAAITPDGRYIAFDSRATNLVPGDTNLRFDVFLQDRMGGTTELVSVSTLGLQGNRDSYSASISPDARWIAFASEAWTLVPGDTNAATDIFLRDRQLATTERVSLESIGGQGNNTSASPAISSDARFVAFTSHASNLVPGDTNGMNDIFVRDRAPTAASFCSGDGSGTACPCGNAGFSGNGCANSLYITGARLIALGTASIMGDSLVLFAAAMPDSVALYYQGTQRNNGGAGTVFGDGLLCVAGTVVRLASTVNVVGASQYPAPGDVPISIRGANSAGDVRTYQVWYRNADPTFCTISTYNLTNGVELTWGP